MEEYKTGNVEVKLNNADRVSYVGFGVLATYVFWQLTKGSIRLMVEGIMGKYHKENVTYKENS